MVVTRGSKICRPGSVWPVWKKERFSTKFGLLVKWRFIDSGRSKQHINCVVTFLMACNFVQAVPLVVITVVLLLGAGGCVRRDGRNSDCKWPAETVHHAATARHLSADAEFAEDLAIRYADT